MSSATPSPDPRSSAHGHHKRHSILPAVSQSGPKPPVQFSSSCTVADSALLTGPHTIIVSTESVIHPRARLESLGGRVTVGRRCIVHERACLGAADLQGRYHKGSPDKDGRSMGAVTLGDYVTVEVGAQVESGGTVIGEGTTVGIGTRVGAGAVVGKVSFQFIDSTSSNDLATVATVSMSLVMCCCCWTYSSWLYKTGLVWTGLTY